MSAVARRVPLARSWAGGAAARVDHLPVPAVLAVFVVVEWVAVLAVALTVRHSGWIYYQGGDQLWYYTLGWLLGHGEIGQTPVGYGWPAFLAPISSAAGPNLVSALPAVVLLDVLVLTPIAMLALYGIAARIGGRLFGYWALLLWVVVPFIGIRYTNPGYHQKYTELLLPQAFGLTAMADFPAMVAVLVSVYFCARDVFDERPRLVDSMAAGVAAGAAIAIKPSAVVFLLGPLAVYAYRRRFSSVGIFILTMAPAVLALAVWKQRGLGHLPILGSAGVPQPTAAGHGVMGTVGGIDLGRYTTSLDWAHFRSNLDLIREHFWSARVIEWLVAAGLIGLARRSLGALLLVGGWFAAFAVVKGSYSAASIEDGSLFRMMMPAYPAFVLLLAGLPLLLPHGPARLLAFRQAFPPARRRLRLVGVGAGVAISAVVPLAAFAAASASGRADAAPISVGTMPVPANIDVGLDAATNGRSVRLDWRQQRGAGGPVFYRMWRGPASGGDGFTCQTPQVGGRSCVVTLPEVGVTRASTFLDRPGPGRWVYRVAVAANWLDDPARGDVYFVSRPVTVTVR
jgi:hypothetical protein